MAVEDCFSFPPELCLKPVPFVGIAGLDIIKNPGHRSIWDAFNKNQNHLPLLFKIFLPNVHLPAVKQKKTSFDRYIPKGVLKKNWMKKHLFEVPAVVAVLFDLNWDDPNWEVNKIQCVQLIQSVKSQLAGHGSKLVLILIQKVAPLPAGDDGRGAERATALCAACDLPCKQLYVVSHDDHLQGYVTRLQNKLLELTRAYYTQEIKVIKSHKDHLNKTTHRYLFVRHNFKMGFYSELKQEDQTARSFYEMAYTCIKEVRPTDGNLQELKLVAGFINYKLCALMFRLREARDALTQLRSHIRLYKPWQGPKSLLFEHYAWLGVQYAAFADLFDEAIRQGQLTVNRSAMQIEHPGIYYRQAALYTMERKQVARDVCAGVNYPADLALTEVEYWGQRGWRPGKLAAEPLDTIAEEQGARALQAKEGQLNHSALIITYLGNGISQFKSFGCPRMRLQLLAQMAREYHSSKDHGTALTFLSHMLWDYRNEKWWQLLAALLQLGLSSAFLCANLQDYITFTIEALSPHVPVDQDTKNKLFQNFLAVLEGLPPTANGDESPDEVMQATALWNQAVAPCPIVVNMDQVQTCFTARAGFTLSEFLVGHALTLNIYIKSHCPGSIQISSIKVTLTSDNFAQEFKALPNSVMLSGDTLGVFECSAQCPLEAGLNIKVGVVSVLFSGNTANGRAVLLKLSSVTPSAIVPNEFAYLRSNNASDDWEKQCGFSTTTIVAPGASVTLSVSHNSPALLGEQFPLIVKVSNNDTFTLYHPVLEVKLLIPGDDSSPDASTRLSDEKQTSISPRNIKIMLNAIAPATSADTVVFLKAYSTGDRNLALTLTYSSIDDMTTPSKMASAVEQQTTVQVEKPFDITHECLTTKFEPANTCYTHETFLLRSDVLVTSPCPITVHQSSIKLGLLVANDCQNLTSQIAGETLYPGDTGTDIFPLKLLEARDQPIAVGTYVLEWSREGSDIITSSSITLPPVKCLPSIISVAMSHPAHGRVRTPMAVQYRLYNRTSALLQLEMHMESSEAFMFSGQRQGILRLLPESERKLNYNLYPLLSGLLAMPRLVLSAPDLTHELVIALERNLPSHVYVMPQEKKASTTL